MYRTLFIDVGGVLLTNGWDRHSREAACQQFGLDFNEMNDRHAFAFDTYEVGHLSLDDYLNYAVFYQSRNFTPDQFKEFMFAQSKAYQEMIDSIKDIKRRYQLKVFAVSNEGRELAEYRINTFRLFEFIDTFICSSFVHLRKPDPAIYEMSLALAHEQAEKVIYIDDRPILAEVGRKLGFKSIRHTNVEATQKILEDLLGGKS